MPLVTVTAVQGNRQSLDGGSMFGNAPRALWEKWVPVDSMGRIPLCCRAMLIEIDGKKILCETGIGAFFEPKLADRFGVVETGHKLIENLNSLGISDGDIEFVILSHLHFDHAGGLLSPWQSHESYKPALLFPNAKFIVGKEAFERARTPHPRDRASFIEILPSLLEQSGRLILIDQKSHPDIFPEHIQFRFTHGHTPGHMHTVVRGKTSSVMFAGDLIPGRAWVHVPITMGYDRFAEQVIDEKRAIYNEFANPESWFFYTHDHEVAMSRIHSDNKGRYSEYDSIAAPIRVEL